MGLTEADFDNITFVNSESGITFNDYRLAGIFKEVKPDLAVFDTLQHFIGASVDLHRANETNASLIHLKNLCEAYDTAAVIIQHISKQAGNGNGGASVGWGLGSMAVNGLFRSVWTVGKLTREADPPFRRALVPSKTNLLPRTPPARIFDLDPLHGFMWAGVSGEVTARDLIVGDKRVAHRPPDRLSDAEDFLQSILERGGIESAELERQAERAGISRATYKRARENLGVKPIKRFNKWYSVLSEQE